MTAVAAWIQLVACASIIGLVGPALTRSARKISHDFGLPIGWAGLVLLATATSLPELYTGISAVTIAKAPNIAMGDALGSCLFNLVMLVALDAFSREEPVWRRIDQGHILTAAFGVILIGLVGALLMFARGGFDFRVGPVSLYSPFLILLYFVAMRAVYFYEQRAPHYVSDLEVEGETGTLRMAVTRYALAALILGLAGAWLPFAGLAVAEAMNWKTAFVGTLLVAAATSLPELVVTIAALRIGSTDMAIGNLLGSNLFVILVIAIDDFAYRQGSFFTSVSPSHALTAFAGSIMSGILIVGLLYRPGNRFFGRIGWISLSLLAVYLLSSYAIYLQAE